MELGFLALVAVSAGLGYLARSKVNRTIGRVILTLGCSALAAGLAILGLTVLGRGPLGTWTAGLVAAVLLAVAVAALPFAVAAGVGRR